jgi:hypothetical protein
MIRPRVLLKVSFAMVVGLLIAPPCLAQLPGLPGQQPGFGQSSQPQLSPYLNLLRPGASAGINYYTLVRPQFQTQSAFLSLQSQLNPLTANANGMDMTPTTGGMFGFQNARIYYQNLYMFNGYGTGPGSGTGTGRSGMGGMAGMSGMSGMGTGMGGAGTGVPKPPQAPGVGGGMPGGIAPGR